MDEDGYFFIVDRKKDMIISGGYNVYPRDIDEVFYQNPKSHFNLVEQTIHLRIQLSILFSNN